MVYNKKAISPVVATALLLVVAVVAVVGFQAWYNTFQSGVLADTESKGAQGVPITVERLEMNQVYLKNAAAEDIEASAITVNGVSCGGFPENITPNVGAYDIPTCNASITQGQVVDVVVVTSQGVYSSTQIVR